MNFLSPERFGLLLLLVAALAGVYVWVQRQALGRLAPSCRCGKRSRRSLERWVELKPLHGEVSPADVVSVSPRPGSNREGSPRSRRTSLVPHHAWYLVGR